MNNKQFGQALTASINRVASAHHLKVCGRCKASFDERDSKYYCGYGKCPTCCGSCMHRNYPNPHYTEKATPAKK